MGTILIGYDTESGTVPEATMNTFKKSISAIMKVHTEFDTPATIFLVGKTLASGARYVRPLADSDGLFDFQQHTYSHVLLKTVVVKDKNNSAYSRRPHERYVEGGSLKVIRKEVKMANNALKKYLDVTCQGIRGPYGYYRGLSDRPDILLILHEEGIRFTSTYLRNEDDWQPVPLEAQPFWYELQGFPDMLEIPGQGWADCIWRDVNGWKERKKYEQYLKSTLDEVKNRNLTWGTIFHDWAIIKADPTAEIMRSFIQYAKENGIKLVSYGQFFNKRRRSNLRRVTSHRYVS